MSLVTLAVGIYFTAVGTSFDHPQRHLIFGASYLIGVFAVLWSIRHKRSRPSPPNLGA